MGYTTDFNGRFQLSRILTHVEWNYINDFSETRRMKRNVEQLMETYEGRGGFPFEDNTIDRAPEEIYGVDGAYYIGEDACIVDYNQPPQGQPGLWCQWVVTNDRSEIEWDGSEKFYNYTEWIEYIIEHFLKPWGVEVNGEVKWYGEDSEDMGIIRITDNEVQVLNGTVTYN